jgi:hypothetical protein
MQDPPPFILPYMFNGSPPLLDPNGPIGQRVDVSSDIGATIGHLARSEFASLHGWMPGEGNIAIPVYGVPGQPPPGAIMTMMAGPNFGVNLVEADAEFITVLYLLLF